MGMDIKESKIYDAVHPMYKNVITKLPSHPHLHLSLIEFITCLDKKPNQFFKPEENDVMHLTTDVTAKTILPLATKRSCDGDGHQGKQNI